MSNELLTIKDVCNLTTLSKASVYREIKKGNLPTAIRITDGRVAWLSSDVKNSTFFKVALRDNYS